MHGGAAGPALIFIDYLHKTFRPTQIDGSLAQIILAFCAFPILQYLQPGRLPYVDKGNPLAVCAVDLRGCHQSVSSEARYRSRRRASWVNRVSTGGGTGVSACPVSGPAMSGGAIGVCTLCGSSGEQVCPPVGHQKSVRRENQQLEAG